MNRILLQEIQAKGKKISENKNINNFDKFKTLRVKPKNTIKENTSLKQNEFTNRKDIEKYISKNEMNQLYISRNEMNQLYISRNEMNQLYISRNEMNQL